MTAATDYAALLFAFLGVYAAVVVFAAWTLYRDRQARRASAARDRRQP